MFDISKIDKNFKVETKIDKEDIKFYKIDEYPFKVYGIFKENGKYRRMDENVAKTVSDGVYELHTNTAGGRIRFVTDSSYIAISVKMKFGYKSQRMPLTGSKGFDLYADNHYVNTFQPPVEFENGYESICNFPEKKQREITINFPLYSDVEDLYIGLQNDATLIEAKPYKNTKPIVYYGSSVTQGGCASRPGMSYQAIISREFDYDYINLGFSGNGRAEDEIAEYISNLDMSVFVYDYDYNAPTPEYLEETHEKMFKTIRNAQPDLPIIMMTSPKFYINDVVLKRRSIIRTTYNNAVSAGDKNVYLIEGDALTELCKGEGTVDGIHPTDFGFASMANAVSKVLANINVK